MPDRSGEGTNPGGRLPFHVVLSFVLWVGVNKATRTPLYQTPPEGTGLGTMAVATIDAMLYQFTTPGFLIGAVVLLPTLIQVTRWGRHV